MDVTTATLGKDSLFMDGDEKELLLRYVADNPTMQSFQDTDDRRRSVEECVAESELEKLISQARALMAARRLQFTREARVQLLPSHHIIPSVLELRELRKGLINGYDITKNGQSHAAFRSIGELLAKETALASETKNTFADSLATLIEFYSDYTSEVATKQLILSRRWFMLCVDDGSQLQVVKQYTDRQRRLSDEHSYCIEVRNRLKVLAEATRSKHHCPSLPAENVHSARLETLAQTGKVPMPIEGTDAQTYVTYHIFQQRVRRRFERFSVKAKLIPHYKRYDLFDRLVKFLLGGKLKDAGQSSIDDSDRLPTMLSDEGQIMLQLEELSTGFKLTGHDKSDLHEFTYHLGKRYVSTHEYQSASFHFQPLSLYVATKGTSEDPQSLDRTAAAKRDNEPVYLRQSPWSSNLFTLYFQRSQPAWETEQLTAMKTITSLNNKSVATTEADHLRIDQQLEADFNFLSEESHQTSIEIWKKRAGSHKARAKSVVPLTEFDRLLQRNKHLEWENAEAGAIQSATNSAESEHLVLQRLQATYQLRYLRTRQFRLQILKTLNYFASILKEIARDCHSSFSISNEISNDASSVEGLAYSTSEEMRRQAVSPMVQAVPSADLPNTEDFEARLKASLGIDDDVINVTTLRKTLDGKGGSSLPDPFWFADRHDVLENNNGLQRSNVRDGLLKVLVMEEWALAELQRVEQRLLFTASFYVNKHLDSSRRAATVNAKMPMGFAPQENSLDMTMIVEDIFECESWFQQSKMNLLDSYREAYLHTARRQERSNLAKSMIELICQVPRLDLGDRSFMPSFTNQVVVLDLHFSLAREMILSQIETERKVLTQMHSSLKDYPAEAIEKFTTYASKFGIYDSPTSDTVLYKPLFPKSSIINVFDIYGSMNVVSSIEGYIASAVEGILGRFTPLDSNASFLFLQKEVLQELLVQWRLLGDEDVVARQLQILSAKRDTNSSDEDEEMSPTHQSTAKSVAEIDTALQGGLYNAVHTREVVERIATDMIRSAGSTDPPPASKVVERPSQYVPTFAATSNGSNVAAPSAAVAARTTSIPAPSALVQAWFSAMEALRLQASIMSALYETNVWCGIHRMQAKLMGVNVNKAQLEPIDFDGKRVFVENDEMETAIQSTFDSDSGTVTVFSLASELALEEAMSFQAEFLQNLSVCEFERSMGDFDLRTVNGVDRLLRSRLGDFRRAFCVQITNKNLYTSVTLCNSVALDSYIEGLYKNHADAIFATLQPAHETHGFLRREINNSGTHTRLRLAEWPLLVKGEIPQQYFIDRRQLQKLFTSVNQIKSVHRKCALQELSHQATLLVSDTNSSSNTIRKDLRVLKESLVDRYCHEITLATIQYGAKYHICALAHSLRALFCADSETNQSFFIFGGKNDMLRSVPRGVVAQTEGRKPATCLLALNGSVDDIRYVPHYAQVVSMTFEVEVPPTQANVRPEHLHLHGSSHLKQNALLDNISSILHDWLAITKLSQAVAASQLPVSSIYNSRNKCDDTWRSELFRMNADIEAFRDPTDLTSVKSYLHHRHVALYLCVQNSLQALTYQSRKLSHGASVTFYSQSWDRLVASAAASNRLVYASDHSASHYFPRCHFQDTIQWLSSTTGDDVPAQPALFEPLRRMKAYASVSGAPIDSVLQELEGSISTLPFNSSEWYSPLMAQHPRPLKTYIQNPSPLSLCHQVSVYPGLAMSSFLCEGTDEERLIFFSEFGKACEMVEDCAEDAQEAIDREAEFQTTFMTATIAQRTQNGGSFTELHYDVAIQTSRRESLRELYLLLLRQVAASVPMEVATKISASLAQSYSSAPLDDVYQRNVIHRSRSLMEREAADSVAGKNRRKGRCVEKDLRWIQCRLLIMEIHKLLIVRTSSEAIQVIGSLETESILMSKLTVSTNKKHATKTTLFSEFCSLLVAKAHCTRGDNEKVVTYHIPDYSLNLAIDTLATKLVSWETDSIAAIVNTTENTVRAFTALVVDSQAKQKECERSLDLAEKALPRRIQVAVAASKYEILKLNAVLSKENELLRSQLAKSRENAREEIRLEFEDQVTDLQARLKTRESQFVSYKKKLFKDMQESLEDVRRSAMFSISSMEHAPVHVKRQALKIAISDDELNTIKDQNAELRQAIVKVKLWYEIKLARIAATQAKMMSELKSKADGSQQNYWNDRTIFESEVSTLRKDLSSLQVSLTKSELEVEVLRKDLQAQLSNKKDLVAWKMQSGKQMEELQRKLKKFEKLSSTYDLDKLVSEHEKRLSSFDGTSSTIPNGQHNASGTASSSARVIKGSTLRATTSRIGSALGVGAPAESLVPFDEYRKLQEQCSRERKMKEQAFEKLDTLRSGEKDANESLVWQRRYLEAASELQRRVSEVESLKAHIDASNMQPSRRV